MPRGRKGEGARTLRGISVSRREPRFGHVPNSARRDWWKKANWSRHPLEARTRCGGAHPAEEFPSARIAGMTEPWIEELLRIIYSGRIINNRLKEAKILKNSHLPGKIYKYRCFNENSLRNLEEDTVWLASPDRYNDPYDCLFSISDEEVLPILQQTIEDQLKGAPIPGAGTACPVQKVPKP